MQQTYRATFNKKPEEIILDIQSLKNGAYQIKGDLSEAYWTKLCQELELEPKGGGTVELTLEVNQPIVHITGEVKTTFERECVRTLEMFTDSHTQKVDEHLTWKEEMAQDEVMYQEEVALDFGDFIHQQIMLGFDLHPVKDRSQRGGVVLSDGFEETAENNPFAVLKQLQKS